VIKQDPLSGHLFAFLNRRGNIVKVLFWDRSGLCILAKRLERVSRDAIFYEVGGRQLLRSRLLSS
jgi:hypothetical protein